MPPFMYRCPNTGYGVQSFTAEGISEEDADMLASPSDTMLSVGDLPRLQRSPSGHPEDGPVYWKWRGGGSGADAGQSPLRMRHLSL